VQKFTGMTRQEVEELNNALKKLDTRTPVEQLNLLAAEAGNLGITGKENILNFVEAADKIQQTLGKSLGDGAIEQITKLTQVFGTDKTLGAQGAILATASAINELDKQTSASGKAIYDFTTSLSAAGKAAGITQADIMGLGATLSANLQDGGTSAQALTKLLAEMYKEPAKFAKAAGLDINWKIIDVANRKVIDYVFSVPHSCQILV
jgi:TP901 family phage tail tape measure protein